MKLGRWIWGMVALWGVVGVALAVVAMQQRPTARAPDQAAPHEQAAAVAGLRTVVVSGQEPAPASTPDGPVQVVLLRGAVEAPTMATVLSDENCEPDVHGYSHCLNELELPDGERIAVRHTHRMSEVPCLSPGERVNLTVA